MVLAPKGRLEQPLDSSLRGLDWKLCFENIYATGRLEFKIGACVRTCVRAYKVDCPRCCPFFACAQMNENQRACGPSRCPLPPPNLSLTCVANPICLSQPPYVVHPPPDQKLVANDQIPSIHYYSGTFCEGACRADPLVVVVCGCGCECGQSSLPFG